MRPPDEHARWWEDPRTEPAFVAAALRGAQLDWRASAWLLERAWPERWGPPAYRAARFGRDDPREPVGREDPFREVDELARRRARSRD